MPASTVNMYDRVWAQLTDFNKDVFMTELGHLLSWIVYVKCQKIDALYAHIYRERFRDTVVVKINFRWFSILFYQDVLKSF